MHARQRMLKSVRAKAHAQKRTRKSAREKSNCYKSTRARAPCNSARVNTHARALGLCTRKSARENVQAQVLEHTRKCASARAQAQAQERKRKRKSASALFPSEEAPTQTVLSCEELVSKWKRNARWHQVPKHMRDRPRNSSCTPVPTS